MRLSLLEGSRKVNIIRAQRLIDSDLHKLLEILETLGNCDIKLGVHALFDYEPNYSV